MTARPLDPESRRRPIYAAVALVLVMVAVLLAAGCFRPQLCGGKFDVYESDDFLESGDNVVHLSEQDFNENPELDEVMRGDKSTNSTCSKRYDGVNRCIGGSSYKCGESVRLIKYERTNKTPNYADERILEYGGKYYYLRFTIVS
jgi:hypothetical protein